MLAGLINLKYDFSTDRWVKNKKRRRKETKSVKCVTLVNQVQVK